MCTIFDLKDIQHMWLEGKVAWSNHATARALLKGISYEDIENVIEHGEIIEEYPSNWLNPACLIYGHSKDNKVIHVVIGVNDLLHVITVYYPNEDMFENDLKTRRH